MKDDDTCLHCERRIYVLHIGGSGTPDDYIWVNLDGDSTCPDSETGKHEPA